MHCSLKSGIHGPGPYTDIRMVLESIITANANHTPLAEVHEGKALKLYFLPWRGDLADGKEFRVFVDGGRITAMSQQHLCVVVVLQW